MREMSLIANKVLDFLNSHRVLKHFTSFILFHIFTNLIFKTDFNGKDEKRNPVNDAV